VDPGYAFPPSSETRAQAQAEAEALAARAPDGMAVIAAMIDHLRGRTAPDSSWTWDRATLSPEGDCLLGQVLGAGEVSGRVQDVDGGQVVVTESVLTGVWTLYHQDRDGRVTARWIEIGAVPRVVTAACSIHAGIDLEAEPPPGAMAVRPLLTEIAAHVAHYEPGQANHVITLSLLPLTAADMAHLEAVLGPGPVALRVRGHGACLIQATGVFRVWSMRILNPSGSVILDTLEVGGVPTAACAAPEDFADSARRLAEIRDAYL